MEKNSEQVDDRDGDDLVGRKKSTKQEIIERDGVGLKARRRLNK